MIGDTVNCVAMPRLASLLQLLLALVLVLNGIGNAIAGASMEVAAITGDAGHASAAAESGMEEAHAGCATPASTPSPGQDDSSCGGSGYCDFACAQVLALVPPLPGSIAMHEGDAGPEHPATGHEAPALAGVTRPPIA